MSARLAILACLLPVLPISAAAHNTSATIFMQDRIGDNQQPVFNGCLNVNDTYLWVYGINTVPVAEYLWTPLRVRSSWERACVGPVARYNTGSHRLTDAGVVGVVNVPVRGDGKLFIGCYAMMSNVGSDRRFRPSIVMPKNRVTWPVCSWLRLGLGSNTAFIAGAKPTIQLGPLFEWRLKRIPATLRGRCAFDLVKPDPNQPLIRLDLEF